MRREMLERTIGERFGSMRRPLTNVAAALLVVALVRVSAGGPLGKDFGHVLILDDQPPSGADQIDSFNTLSGAFKGSHLTIPSSNRERLVAESDEAAILIPADDTLGQDWTAAGFEDAGWMAGPTGVGYGFEADEGRDSKPIIYFDFETREGQPVSDGQVAEGQVDEKSGHPDGPFHGVGSNAPDRISDGLSYSSDVPAALAHSEASIEFDEFNPNPEAFELSLLPDPIVDMTLGDFTMHTWFKSTDEGRSIFMGTCCAGGGDRLNFELHTGNRIRVWINGPGGTSDLNVSVAPGNSRDGEWHAGTAVRREEMVELYFDGVLVGEMLDVAGSYSLAQQPLFFGRDDRVADTRFDGKLDDVALWNLALEPEEIQALAAGAPPTSGDFPEPIAYWDFETKDDVAVEDGEPALGIVDENAGHPDGPFDGLGTGDAPPGGDLAALNYSEDVPDFLDHSEFSLEIEETGAPESFVLDPMPEVLRDLPLGDMTIHTWFKTTDTGRSIMMGCFGNASPNQRVNFELHTGNRIRAWINGPGATTDLNVGVDAEGDSRDDEWHSGAMVRRGETVELYYEGVLIDQTVDVAGAFTQLPPAYFFGRDYRTGDTRFSGKLDDIAIWNEALSPGQLEALADGASPLELPGEGEMARELIQTDIERAMRDVNASVYLRMPFDLADPSRLQSLSLDIQYDDGFVAYVNGAEVARRNAPDVPAWNSSALGERGNSVGLVTERAATRAFVPTDDSLGVAWTAVDFDDADWITGRLGVGYDTSETDPEDSPMPIAYWPFETADGDPVDDMQSSDLELIDDLADHPDGPFEGMATGGQYSADAAPLAHSSFSWVVDESQVIADTFELTPMPTPVAELTVGDFTMHTWFKSTDTGRSVFMGSCCEGGSERLNFELHTGNRIRIWINGPAATTDLNVSVAPGDSRDGEWHAGTAVRRGDSVELYFDGELVGEAADVAGEFVQAQQTYFFGRDSREGDTRYDGSLDDIAFWNLALTPPQIAALANGASPLGLPGAGSIGAKIGTDLEAAMAGKNASAYVRVPFEVADPSAFSSLLLRMQYDDGFVAFLNGQEIARRGAPAAPTWNSSATEDRGEEEAEFFEDFDVSDALDRLQAGTNVLAIHGLNSSADAAAFLVLPQLLASEPNSNSRALKPEKIDISAALDVLVPGRNVLAIHGLNATAGAAAFLILPELVTTGPNQEATGITDSGTPGFAYALTARGNLYEVDWYRGETIEIADLGVSLAEDVFHRRYDSITSVPGSDLLYILRTDRGSGQFDSEDFIDTYDPRPDVAEPYTTDAFTTSGFTAIAISDGPPFPPFGEAPALYSIGTEGDFEAFNPSSPGTGQLIQQGIPPGTSGALVALTSVPGDDFQMYVLQDSDLDGDPRDKILVFSLDGELENLFTVEHNDGSVITDSAQGGFLFSQALAGPAAHIDLLRGAAGVMDVGRGASTSARAATSIPATTDPEKFIYLADDRAADHIDVHDAHYTWAAGSADNLIRVTSTGAPAAGEDWADSALTDGGGALWQLYTDGRLYRIDPDTGAAAMARNLGDSIADDPRRTFDSITNVYDSTRLFILRTDRPLDAKIGGDLPGVVDVFDPVGGVYTPGVYTTVGTGMTSISDGPPFNGGDVNTERRGAVYLIAAGGSFEVLDPAGSGTTTRIQNVAADGVMVSLTNMATDFTHMYAFRDRMGDDEADRIDVLDITGGAELDAFELGGTNAKSITDMSEGMLYAASTDGAGDIVELDARLVHSFDAGTATHHASVTNIDTTIPEPPEPPDPERVSFKRGDTTQDGTLNITDAVKVFSVLFTGEAEPTCRETMDANNDGAVNITDGIGILGFLFSGGAPPAAPGHEVCGPDPDEPGSPGDSGCESYPPCEG